MANTTRWGLGGEGVRVMVNLRIRVAFCRGLRSVSD